MKPTNLESWSRNFHCYYSQNLTFTICSQANTYTSTKNTVSKSVSFHVLMLLNISHFPSAVKTHIQSQTCTHYIPLTSERYIKNKKHAMCAKLSIQRNTHTFLPTYISCNG